MWSVVLCCASLWYAGLSFSPSLSCVFLWLPSLSASPPLQLSIMYPPLPALISFCLGTEANSVCHRKVWERRFGAFKEQSNTSHDYLWTSLCMCRPPSELPQWLSSHMCRQSLIVCIFLVLIKPFQFYYRKVLHSETGLWYSLTPRCNNI